MVSQLLNQFNAPADCIRLMLVLENLDLILCSIKELGAIRENLPDCPLFSGSDPTRALLQGLREDIESNLSPWVDRSTKQRGIINEHPEWAMMIMNNNNPRFYDTTFRQHQGLVRFMET